MIFSIDRMQRQDWSRVRAIYGEGLATGLAAFQTDPPRWADWNAGHLAAARLVARTPESGNAGESTVIGWSALAPVPDT